MDYSKIDELMKIPLSDGDISSVVGIPKEAILKYSDLSEYRTIADLLPNNGDFKIILLEYSPNNGHWVVFYKLDNKYFYFNSYGNAPDNDLNCLNRCVKIMLGQNVREFRRLLGKNKMIHSAKRYQRGNSQVCGRLVCMRVMFLQMGYNQDEFNEIMEKIKEQSALSAEEISCMYVPIHSEKS
jgi:hypothetical protein